jgi:hypothetical protein
MKIRTSIQPGVKTGFRFATLFCLFALLVACNAPPQVGHSDVGLPSDRDASQIVDSQDDAQSEFSTPTSDGSSALGQIGAACAKSADCVAGLSCDTDLPLGACSKACSEDQDCGDSAYYGCAAGKCRSRCDISLATNPCRDDYVCERSGVQANCVPDCRKTPCSHDGWTCDNDRGLCIDLNGGKFGEACGAEAGNCDGTPNGICYSLAEFTRPFCTVGCSLFTNPCPAALTNAGCIVGSATNAYCAYYCDLPNVPCPSEQLKCVAYDQDFSVCIPKGPDDE